MVDPGIRMQNIALEHAELTARRSMSWAESTNRTTMFMTVVSAAVVGLALFGQAGAASGDMALLSLLILGVVLLIGLTTLLRIGQLDEHDMLWIQGLNRLRAMRLEIDPGLAPYLVTSPHDDFDSVLKAYTTDNESPVYAFGTLLMLVLTVNCVLVGAVGGLLAVNFGVDPMTAVVVGVVAGIGFLIATGLWMYRAVRDFPSRLKSIVPASVAASSAGQAANQVIEAASASREPDAGAGPAA